MDSIMQEMQENFCTADIISDGWLTQWLSWRKVEAWSTPNRQPFLIAKDTHLLYRVRRPWQIEVTERTSFFWMERINPKQSHYGSQTSVIHRSERVHFNAHWWKDMWMGALLVEWFLLLYYKNCMLEWDLLDRGVVTVVSLSILTCFNWNTYSIKHII